MEYTKKQISELTGLPARSVQYFTERSVVIPAVESTGTGKFRIYSERNLFQFALIKQLSEFGMTIDVIRRICRGVFKSIKGEGNPYDPQWIEENKPYVVICNHWDAVSSDRRPKDGGHFVPGVFIVPVPDRSKRPDFLNHPNLIGAKSVILIDLYAALKGLLK